MGRRGLIRGHPVVSTLRKKQQVCLLLLVFAERSQEKRDDAISDHSCFPRARVGAQKVLGLSCR